MRLSIMKPCSSLIFVRFLFLFLTVTPVTIHLQNQTEVKLLCSLMKVLYMSLRTA